MVKTAVLLAAYNGEKYLQALLFSLRQQSDQDFHVLCQDDGSSDGTPAILASAAAAGPRLILGSEQGKHLGPPGNFLSLLRQTDADWILLCDQDDIWEPDKIRLMKKEMTHAEQLWGQGTPVLIHSDCSLIDSDGHKLAPSFFRLQGWDPSAVTLPPLLVQNNATGCTMMLNRSLIDLICRYGQAENMFMHDWFIVLTAAAFGHVLFLNLPLVRYRQHAGNAIGASRSSLLNRGLAALHARRKAQERIKLTYTHTRAFLEAYREILPESADRTIRDYLATESMPKWKRIREIRRLGCIMQNPVTRIGQIIFS